MGAHKRNIVPNALQMALFAGQMAKLLVPVDVRLVYLIVLILLLVGMFVLQFVLQINTLVIKQTKFVMLMLPDPIAL